MRKGGAGGTAARLQHTGHPQSPCNWVIHGSAEVDQEPFAPFRSFLGAFAMNQFPLETDACQIPYGLSKMGEGMDACRAPWHSTGESHGDA